ncbi:MAG: hypothetical protein ACRDB2_03835 [Fusobacteriaceae bacterium]
MKNIICLKVGMDKKNGSSFKNGEKVIETIISYLEKEKIDKVAVVKTEFNGYSGENPSLEVVIPEKGQVVFGNVSPEEILEILQRYLIKNDEILKFLEKNI